jgi:hypothetical protein
MSAKGQVHERLNSLVCARAKLAARAKGNCTPNVPSMDIEHIFVTHISQRSGASSSLGQHHPRFLFPHRYYRDDG